MSHDQITVFARKAINILFASNPKGTSLGILIGVSLDGLLGFFSPLMKTWEWANAAALKTWHLIAIGVIGMNLPAYLARNKIDQSILNAIDYIERQKSSGNINDWQARQMFFKLHEKVLESVTLDTKTQAAANGLRAMSHESSDRDSADNG